MRSDHKLLEDQIFKLATSDEERQRIAMESQQFQNYKTEYEKWVEIKEPGRKYF